MYSNISSSTFKNYLLLCIYLLALLIFTPISHANSLEVEDTDLRQLLSSLAAEANINIVIDPEINGKASIKLSQLSPEAMLDAIARGYHLHLTKKDNVLFVQASDKHPSLHTVYVHYLDLEQVANKIALLLPQPSTSKAKTTNSTNYKEVIIDPYNNSITFCGTETDFTTVKNFLVTEDLAPKQVSLEAKVVAIQKDASKDLGIDWSWSHLPQNSNNTTQEFPTAIRFGKNIDGNPYTIGFGAKLSALISSGKGTILAKPNITTIQGHEAIINIGGEVPIPVTTTANNITTNSIKYRPAGIILQCTPRVNEPGIITVKIHTEVSNPSYVEEMKAYRFQKRSADTLVRLKQGETMVIGGLINSDETKAMSNVPLLSKIPLLGSLFKHTQKSKHRTEVMIFLTAKEV